MFSRSLLIACCALLPVASTRAAEPDGVGRVSRTPPTVFAERLEPLLTPLETARQLPKSGALRTAGPVIEVLLREVVIHVEEDGRETTSFHDITSVLNKEAADLYREDENYHRPGMERMHLVKARTVREDGTEVPVKESAVFVKRPESGRDMHLDTEDLHLVFPDVVPGVLLEKIVVRETVTPVMPGEFLHQEVWADHGPCRRLRLVVDLPEGMLPRLRSQGLGFKLPAVAQQAAGPGRVRLEWRTDAVAPADRESGGPPLTQGGPALRLSTLRDWDAVGQWFAGLLKERSTVTDELKKLAREWADGAGTPEEIAAALFLRVSSEVRYTALEFGKGSHQPRAPAEVLATRYGDCKDKANLLRLLLREHGIASRIALLDTRHAGAIDKEVPSFGRFDHAILAVDFAGAAGPRFCDPTIAQAEFGTLAPGDVERDALLIADDGRTAWVETPAQTLGRHETVVDLTLEPGGGLSGWVTLRAEGYHAALLRQSVEKNDRAAAVKSLENGWLAAFRASVMDFTILPASRAQAGQGCAVRAYIVRGGAAVAATEDGSERVVFPLAGIFLPRLGTLPERRTPMVVPRWQTEVSGTFQLPAGWTLLDTPPACTREAGGWKCALSWEAKKRTLTCRGSSQMGGRLIQPAAHRALWQAQRDVVEWLKTPAVLKRPAAAKGRKPDADGETPAPWCPPPGSLPKMPSVEGQIALVDERFPLDPNNPFDGDHRGRSAAAKKMIEYFPGDHLANFEGGMRIAIGDLLDGDLEQVPKRIQELLAKHGPHVEPRRVVAGQVLLATALVAKGKPKEALPLALAVVENPQLPTLMRQAAAFLAGVCVEKDDPRRALELVRQTLEVPSLPLPSLLPAAALAMMARARLPETKPDDLVADWNAILKRYSGQAAELREAIVEAPASLLDSAHLDAAERLHSALGQHAKAGGYTDEEKQTMDETGKSLAEARSAEPLHARIRDWLKAHPWPDADKIEADDAVDTFEECQSALEDHYENRPVSFRYALRLLTHYGPQPDFAEHVKTAAEAAFVWLEVVAVKKKGVPKPPEHLEAALDMLVQAWADTPDDKLARHRAAIFRGSVIQRREGAAAALVHFRALAADAGISDSVRVTAHQEAGFILSEQKDYPALFEEWRKLEAFPDSHATAAYRVRAAYLALALGQRAEAWPCLELAAKSDPANFRHLLPEKLHADIKSLTQHRADAEAWWKQSDVWWRQWEALAKQTGFAAPDDAATSMPWGDFDKTLKYAETLRKNRSEASDRQAYTEHLHRVLLTARWHRAFAAPAAKLLREHIARHYPQQARAALALAQRIEKEAGAKR